MKEISEFTVGEDVFLVTADVTSLYTIIPHELGYQVARFFLNKELSINSSTLEFVMKLLNFAMEHNYFFYGGQFYLQVIGVAMGAKFSPSLAGLFMALWENDTLFFGRAPPPPMASLYR